MFVHKIENGDFAQNWLAPSATLANKPPCSESVEETLQQQQPFKVLFYLI